MTAIGGDGVLCQVMCRDEQEAAVIGRTVVEERLAASANLLGASRSFYWWQDRLETAAEWLLGLKTTADAAPRLLDRIVELHSYDCPAIVMLPILAMPDAYRRWLRDQVKG